ncbi:MAG: hypothetical protein E6Q89_07080 [Bacteroidia bacterium]|nr:MAG: hypothetical protein E6Q89_07080 [Bacteroidia bacterium]
MESQRVAIIPKEEVSHYKLVPAEIDQSTHWKHTLDYAVRLGNEFKSKTYISFLTSQGARAIETTVWSLTENHIEIKGGIDIPLNSIIDIHY